MTQLIEYIVKSVLCAATFWVLFKLIAERFCSYNFQRIYILLSALFTLVFPLITIPLGNGEILGMEKIFSIYLPELIIKADSAPGNSILELFNISNISWEKLNFLFFTVSAMYTAHVLIQLIILFLLWKTGEKSCQNGFDIIISKRVKSPFSFFRLIFVNSGLRNEDGLEQVICHETSHITRKHSMDLLFMSGIKIFQWFNPFVFLLGKSLSSLHEFQADNDVLRKGYKLEDYQRIILSLQFGISPLLANRLNSSLTIKRLRKMRKLIKEKSSIPGVLTLALFTTALFFFISWGDSIKSYAQTIVPESQTPPPPPDKKKTETPPPPPVPAKEKVAENEMSFEDVEVKPKFQEGDESTFTRWVFERLVYPETAKKEGIQGKVILSFLINKDGSICDIKVEKSANPLLDKEAIRVVSSSPKWTPGKHKGKIVKVHYTFPVIFQLR